MSYRIGSFNVRNLSFAAGKERLDHIADLIREFDIVALQEVLSEGKMLEGAQVDNPAGQQIAYENSLRYRLGDNWDMCWLDPRTESKWYPYIGKDSRGEGYAFLWRKNLLCHPYPILLDLYCSIVVYSRLFYLQIQCCFQVDEVL